MRKNILITGASTGIGFAIAESFAKNGNNVFLVSKNKQRLTKATNQIKKKYDTILCECYCCDIIKKNSLKKIYNNFIKKFKKIHILINNVGGGSAEEGENFDKITDKNFNIIYKKNISSTFGLTKLALSSMAKNNWGRIITISSSVNQKFSGKPVYKMNKIAQVSLIKSLSTQKKYTKKNITFNCVSPGPIFTETSKWLKLKKKNPKKLKKIIDKDFPLGIGKPKDVANVVKFLSEEESAYINGTNIIVDGGALNLNKAII